MDFLNHFFETLQADLSAEYITSARTTSIILALITCGLFIFTALSTKRGVGFGIFAGILNGFSIYASHAMVVLFHRIDFVLYETIYGAPGEIDDLVAQAKAEYFAKTIPDIIALMLCNFIMIAAWIIALVYMIHLLKIKPRVLTIFAILIHAVRYVCIYPIKLIQPILNDGATVEMQMSQNTIYHIAVLMPVMLFSLCALIHLLTKKKRVQNTENT